MQFFDIEALKKGLKQNKQYKPMLLELQAEVDDFFDNFNDDPSKLSGWGHRYFCEACGGALIYNYKNQTTHVCEVCGKKHTGHPYDDVGVYNYRNLVITNLMKSSLLYKYTSNKKYLDYVIKTTLYYANNYLQFPLHDKEGKIFASLDEMTWGCGRIQPQGLNEAIFVVKLCSALQIVKDELSQEFLDTVHKNLFVEVFTLLKMQTNKIHNIICWYNCAIGVMGFFSNDQEMISFINDGKFCFANQVNQGVTADGFWYEGSIHYNFFTLEGIVNLLLFAHLYNKPFIKEEQVVSSMLNAAYEYAFDSHRLPNPNDGWPNINLKTYSYVYTIATKFLGYDSKVANLLKNIENSKVEERACVPLSRPYYYNNQISLERLILIPDLDFKKYSKIKAQPHNFSESQFAILRNKNVNVFLKYGHRGPSHAHPDKMTIEVLLNNSLLTRDLSNSGYGQSLCDEWHRTTASHNTVCYNGESQVSMSNGQTIDFTGKKIKAACEYIYTPSTDVDIKKLQESLNEDEFVRYVVKNLSMSIEDVQKAIEQKVDLQALLVQKNAALPKVDYTRQISLKSHGFDDKFQVASTKKGIFDYFFHSQAKLISNLTFEKAELGFTKNGYQHLKNIRKVITNDSQFELEWLLDNSLVKTIIDLKNMELFICDTFDNPVSEFRTTLILRYIGKKATYNLKWRIA